MKTDLFFGLLFSVFTAGGGYLLHAQNDRISYLESLEVPAFERLSKLEERTIHIQESVERIEMKLEKLKPGR